MKVLVLGYGSAGRRHVEHLKALKQTVGVYDPKQAPLADPDVRCFAHEDMAWLWEPDAVVIATPAETHARLVFGAVAVKACQRVFVEKPLYLDCLEVPVFACPLPEVFQVGYQLRCHAGARALKLAVEEGRVGRVWCGRFYTGSHLDTWSGSGYADALLECSHELDAARWLFGDAEVVGAVQHGDTWEVALRHACGICSTVHMSTAERQYRREWEVVGLDGVVRWDSPEGHVTLARGGTLETIWRGGPVVENIAAYRAQLAAFVAGTTSPCTLGDGLAVLRLCDRARVLAQTLPTQSFV